MFSNPTLYLNRLEPPKDLVVSPHVPDMIKIKQYKRVSIPLPPKPEAYKLAHLRTNDLGIHKPIVHPQTHTTDEFNKLRGIPNRPLDERDNVVNTDKGYEGRNAKDLLLANFSEEANGGDFESFYKQFEEQVATKSPSSSPEEISQSSSTDYEDTMPPLEETEGVPIDPPTIPIEPVTGGSNVSKSPSPKTPRLSKRKSKEQPLDEILKATIDEEMLKEDDSEDDAEDDANKLENLKSLGKSFMSDKVINNKRTRTSVIKQLKTMHDEPFYIATSSFTRDALRSIVTELGGSMAPITKKDDMILEVYDLLYPEQSKKFSDLLKGGTWKSV
jgi:hypothetical protein